MANETPKPAKARAKRRDFKHIVESTQAYVEAGIAAITAFVPDGPSKDGQLDALKAVLKRLTGNE